MEMFSIYLVLPLEIKDFVVLCLVFLNYKRKDEGANNMLKLQEFKLLYLILFFKTVILLI